VFATAARAPQRDAGDRRIWQASYEKVCRSRWQQIAEGKTVDGESAMKAILGELRVSASNRSRRIRRDDEVSPDRSSGRGHPGNHRPHSNGSAKPTKRNVVAAASDPSSPSSRQCLNWVIDATNWMKICLWSSP
jgi:hypothetical protein